MSGKTIRVLPRTKYDFSTLINASQTLTQTVAKQVTSAPYKEGVLQARLHTETFTQANGELVEVKVVNDAHTDEDPQDDFLDVGGSVASVTFSQTVAAERGPVSKSSSMSTIGSMVAVQVVGTRVNVVTGTTTFTVTLSADLVLRD